MEAVVMATPKMALKSVLSPRNPTARLQQAGEMFSNRIQRPAIACDLSSSPGTYFSAICVPAPQEQCDVEV